MRTTDNPFFHELYRNFAAGLNADERFLHRLEAREHTAQVDSDQRHEREDRFRSAELPMLLCSPTMELGVDRVVAELLIDHAVSDELAAIYDRGDYWHLRVAAAQRWADHVMGAIEAADKVVSLRAAQ